jgi:two-component system, cell cycle sensor histidine kinase and response regulator CckA
VLIRLQEIEGVMTKRHNLLSAVVVASAGAAVFLLGRRFPLGMVDATICPAVVLLSLWLPRQRHTYMTAAACTVFVVLGLFLSSPDTPFWPGVANRLAGILVLWTVALYGRFARQRAERLREQAALLDQVPDAVLVRDLANRIRFWNRGAEKLYGWTADEVLGRGVDELLFRDPAADLTEVARAVLEQGGWGGEMRQVARDGSDIIVETRWILLRDYQGHPQSKLVVNTDVTARRKLEAQLLRAQRLESIGTLTGGIAHDFNNLLNPILMSAKLLQSDRPEDERRHLLKILQASAERGATMVKGLLAFAGGADRQTETLNPCAVVREVKAILDHTFPRSIRIQSVVADNLWALRVDATQLSQVLMNLCVNARDAMPEGGTLTISAENRLVDRTYASRHHDAKPGPHVAISVADTGSGIRPDLIERIFDPFFTTKEPGKGTGLGLSTALGIVKSHGGFIDLHSERDKGTRFVVHMPAVSGAEAEPAVRESEEIPRGQGELILVVDDEPYIRETTRAALEVNGYRVLTAGDGSEGLALYREHRVEIRAVLLDMVMPVLDGPATMDALRQLDPQVRILPTSGSRTACRVATAMAPEKNAFLQKPYKDEEMLVALARVLSPR